MNPLYLPPGSTVALPDVSIKPEDVKETWAAFSPGFAADISHAAFLLGDWFTVIQGFNTVNVPGDLMLITSELAELLEAHRKGEKAALHPTDGVAAELADTLIRVLHFASKYEIPLGKALVAKMAYNFSRPLRHAKEY